MSDESHEVPDKLIEKLKHYGFPEDFHAYGCECDYHITHSRLTDYTFNFCDRGTRFTILIDTKGSGVLRESVLGSDEDWQAILGFMKFLKRSQED